MNSLEPAYRQAGHDFYDEYENFDERSDLKWI
jgi:hypothetical protein